MQPTSMTSRSRKAIPKTASSSAGNYKGYSLAEMKEALDRQGIEYPKRARKAKLEALLEVEDG